MAIPWKRGLFRTWVLFAVVWIGYGAYAVLTDTGIPSLTKGCEVLREFRADATGKALGDEEVAQCWGRWSEDKVAIVERMFGPPLLLLVVGSIGLWVLRGFRTR
jgi:hypothetical protein